MSDVSAKPVIFISYSHKDEPEKPGPDEVAWLTFVQSFLAPVVKIGIFDIWVDEHLHGSDVIDAEVLKKLAECDIFVLLASRFSLASTYVVETEIAAIRKRQNDGEDVRIFPIVLSPIPNTALKQLKDLLLSPKDGKPLSLMSRNDREVAMAEVADDIADVAEEIAARKAKAEVSTAIKQIGKATFDALATQEVPVATPRVHVDTAHLPETPYERLVGREAQLDRLDKAWADRNTNILSLIAEGGAGKSALVNEWLKGMRANNYRGAETVLGWSFYSQGTKERATSAEQFLNWAIGKLGIEIETTSATAKGEAIAEVLSKRRVLLVLDGCEPLQHGLDKQQGELKDQGLRALLRRFGATAPDDAHGLAVLTSRLAIKDIARWEGESAPVVNVEQLSDEAGAALLRDNGVWGTDKELRAASKEFGDHPLALGLLASFLKETQFGDVRRRDRIRQFFADTENPRHDHARRVMESYEQEWLADHPIERAIMKMVGLFDRPASGGCLEALRQRPVIHGLTDALIDIDDGEWRRAMARLRDARLLAPIDSTAPEAIDAHPLVREWFGERFREKSYVAWKEAHGRIYEHLRDNTEEGKMPTLQDLAPLYQAVAHGCRAGRHFQTSAEILRGRIFRLSKSGDIEYYSLHQLGAYGSDLAAISWLFEKPYEVAEKELSDATKAWLLNHAAFTLAAQGRLVEGVQSFRAALQMAMNMKDWVHVAAGARNLYSIEALVGDTAAAVMTAKQSVSFAERTGDLMGLRFSLASYADSLHIIGKDSEAGTLFKKMERLQRRLSGGLPDRAAGYLYGEFLLAKGYYVKVRDRANQTIIGARKNNWLAFIALDFLSIGRASTGLALRNCRRRPVGDVRADILAAKRSLNQAIDGLRAAGRIDYIPRGHLARAVFHRSIGDWEGTARDLDEVDEVAEPGAMKLFICDMALEQARLAFAKIEAFAPLNEFIENAPSKPVALDSVEMAQLRQDAVEHLAIAADYITTCGYHRRDEELAELQAVLRGERKFADLPPRV